MQSNQRNQVILTVGGLFALLLVFVVLGSLPIGDSLAYPPASYTAPAYPGPGEGGPTATPTPTTIVGRYQVATLAPTWPGSTWTPWPSPPTHAFSTAAVPRQGVGGDSRLINDWDDFGRWGYGWHSNVLDPWPSTVEFVPMYTNITPKPTTNIRQVGTRRATVVPGQRYWLVFNECENDNLPQCNTSPNLAAQFYFNRILPDMQNNGVNPWTDLIIGGVNANPCGILWLEQFVAAYEQLSQGQPVPRAGWHFHIYPEVLPTTWNWQSGSTNGCATWTLPTPTLPPPPVTGHGYWWGDAGRLSFNYWRSDALNVKAFVYEYGDPAVDQIWVSEIGCLIGQCAAPGFMYDYTRQILTWLNSDEGRFIDRYAWYTDWNDANIYYSKLYSLVLTSTPTPGIWLSGKTPTPIPTPTFPPINRSTLGHYYAHMKPAASTNLPVLSPQLYLPFIVH